MRYPPQLFFLLSTLLLSCTAKDVPDDDFFLLCSGGNHGKLASLLDDHPEWVHAQTKDSEHCLHLAGIRGYPEVTKLFLEKGADPNVRSNPGVGLRMTPLSWNVYGNHLENCALLLQQGADVNADFDTSTKTGGKEKITVLDLLRMFQGGAAKDEFKEMEELLLKYGAKTYRQLAKDKKN